MQSYANFLLFSCKNINPPSSSNTWKEWDLVRVWRIQHRSLQIRTFLVAYANSIVSAKFIIILSDNVKTDVGPMNSCR